MKLVRDNLNPKYIDGVLHIPWQLLVHAIVSASVWTSYGNTHALVLANWIVVAAMLVFWVLSEHFQERKMVKNNLLREYRWSQHRWQDVIIPTLSGVAITVGLKVFL